MANNHSSKRPATTLRCGNIKATVLQNVIENGPSFATTFSQLFDPPPIPWTPGYAAAVLASYSAGES
jgi:hypothetical protein